MLIKELLKTSRSITVEVADGEVYQMKEQYKIRINGKIVKTTDLVVTSVFHLKPETEYLLEYLDQQGVVKGCYQFCTEYEFVTLNVRDFGARGDGIQDDTAFIQAAIMCCPKDGRVLIPKGKYRISGIFLKSDLCIEIMAGAELEADTSRFTHPILPGLIESYDEQQEYNLGTWEGNPLPMFAGIITGINVENVIIYGEGIVNGNASKENWWNNPKVKVGAYRPRSLFLNNCRNVIVQGITFINSPSWTLHPYFSDHLGFYSVTIENPKDSPNTDGLDPESCQDVTIKGGRFSLGDDCIAVKSGKIYMGRKHQRPSENIVVSQCLMEFGHGAVTIGSEIAGGVKNLLVENCLFRHTDRGLRVKTRRGRGKDAILDKIEFRNIIMDHVKTPFVVNSFYYCDPDGKSDYVQSRDPYPVDDRTPVIKSLKFNQIICENCHVCAGFFYGLPEQKIKSIELNEIKIVFAENAAADVPAMLKGVGICIKKGFDICNVETLICKNVTITGHQGEQFKLDGVNQVL